MPAWDLLLTDAHIATMRAGGDAWGVIEDGAVALSGGRIAWVGPRADLPQDRAGETRSLGHRWVTPALIDCHTHLVFAGNRAAEFEQRLKGARYEEIARSGGGIMSTVNATRTAGADTLMRESMERIAALRSEGVATIEIKSGYGLETGTERRLLEVARELGRQSGVEVVTTFLGAHAVPAEYLGRTDDYVNLVCDEMLPSIAEDELADAVDGFCESIAFSPEQVARVFERAASFGLPVKLHADQLSDGGGAALAAAFGALSADHLEYTSEAGVRAMADAGCVAVMLPGAFLTLGETQLPPLDALRDAGVPLALATDCNPGTSPVCSIRAAMNLGSTLFGMTPEECLAGVTREAAAALGLADDRGTIEAGKRADLAIWDIGHPRDLPYWLGLNQLTGLLIGGRDASTS